MHRLSLLIVLSGFLCAQSPSGAPLAVTAPQSVKAMVDLQAVLMPYSVNRDLFGKYIADTYAVVFLSVGNRSREAGLVLEGLSLDYSNWALSGVGSQGEAYARSLESFQASTQVGRVSSVEYRIVRAQLEEQDTKTARSWAIRFLEYASSAMGSTGFLFGPATNAPPKPWRPRRMKATKISRDEAGDLGPRAAVDAEVIPTIVAQCTSASPSVSSMDVPQGSEMKAMAMCIAGTGRYG